MSDQKTIYIHIGLQKTGTTTIQNFCANNRETLMDYDLLYPNSGIAYRVKHYKLRSDIKSNKINSEETSNHWDFLIQEIKTTKVNKILISDEGFNNALDPSQIEWIYNKLYEFKVKIILYLRDPTDYLFSFYKFGTKFGIYYPFSKYIDKNIYRCNFEFIIAKWANVFGEENLIIKIYELSKSRNLLLDFLDEIIVRDDFLTKKALNYSSKNQTLSNNKVKSLLFINFISRALPFILGFKSINKLKKWETYINNQEGKSEPNLFIILSIKIAIYWFRLFQLPIKGIKRNTKFGQLLVFIMLPLTLIYKPDHDNDYQKIKNYFKSLEKPLLTSYLLSQLSEDDIQNIKWLNQSISRNIKK